MPGVVKGRWAPSAGRRVGLLALEVLELVLGERCIIFEKLNLESLFEGDMFVEANGDVGDNRLGSLFDARFLSAVFGDEDPPSFDDFLRKILNEAILLLVFVGERAVSKRGTVRGEAELHNDDCVKMMAMVQGNEAMNP